MTAASLFDGRLVWSDHFLGSAVVDSATAWYDYNETQAAFTIARGPSGLTMSMLAASTAGGYLDGQACRVRPVAGSPNMEILFKWTAETTTENFPGVWVRGDGTNSGTIQSRDATCYWIEIASTASTLQLVKSVGGSATVIGAAASSWTNGTETYMRCAALGTNFYAKAWPASQAEPADWQLKLSDTSIVSGNRIGFGLNGGNSGTSDYSGLIKGFWAWDLSAVPVERSSSYDDGTVTGTVAASLGNFTAQSGNPILDESGNPILDESGNPILDESATSGFVGTAGSVARTLGAVTSATSGSSVIGTVARTLQNSVVAASSVSSNAGTIARTLAPVVVQATGGFGTTGSVARTLGNATVVAAGAADLVTGTVAVTLASVEVNAPLTDDLGAVITDDVGNPILIRGAEGSHGLGATAAVTLANVTAVAVGQTGGGGGTVAVTLGNVTSTTSGGSGVTGTTARTLGNATTAAAGVVGVTGIVAVSLANATSTAAGTSTPPSSGVAGNVGVTLAAVVAASGGSSTAGAITRSLADATVAASGTGGLAPVTGLAAIVLADIVSTTVGTAGTTGAVARTLADLVANGVAGGVAGTLAVTLADLTSTSVGAGLHLDFQSVTIRDRGHSITVREMN